MGFMTSELTNMLMPPDEGFRARRMIERLSALADHVVAGAALNPTGLLCIRNTKLSTTSRLRYRALWIGQMIALRRAYYPPQIVEMIDAAYTLTVARQYGLSGVYLSRNRELGATLAKKLRRIQPGVSRLSHYCSRRTGPDAELLAVEFYAGALEGLHMDGTEDYLAAMYCVCRRPDFRFRLTVDAAPKLRALATDWALICEIEPAPAARNTQ